MLAKLSLSGSRARHLLAALGIAGLSLVSGLAFAQQKAGEITHLQGLATATQPGGQPRFLAVGDPVNEGDTLTTTERGYAVVALSDGSKMTLRPSTTFQVAKFAHNPANAGDDDALSMRLFKGGMRMITGLVGKRNPNGVEMRTATATVGIRGTSFDARLCGDDCRAEGITPAPTQTAQANTTQVVARVVEVNGRVTAALKGGAPRVVSQGAALYEGDDIRTEANATAMLGFRDQTRVSLTPNSAFRIDSFTYGQGGANANDGVAMSLLKGGLRAFTGLIGKAKPEAMTIKTSTATIGIRGTGLDLSCQGPCVDPALREPTPPATPGTPPSQNQGMFLFTWEGGTYLVGGPDVPLNQSLFLGADNVPRLLAALPDFFNALFGPGRPPGPADIDWTNLFSSTNPSGGDGLYIGVREGHVYLLSESGGRIDLGIGESGFLSLVGTVQRLSYFPGFMLNDAYPLPEALSANQIPIFQLFGVTLGQPGQEMCRL